MKCTIDYSVNGLKAHVTLEAASSIDALLQVLATLPPSAAVKALVRVLEPSPEIVQ